MIGNMEAGDCADYGADAVEERVGRGPAPDGKGDDAVVAETASAPVSRDGFAREDGASSYNATQLTHWPPPFSYLAM